jgi:hypothetical protein
MSAQQNLAATVFVYRRRIDGRIHAEYIETARVMKDSPDWEHLATLEPRMWIQAHYDAVTQSDKLLAALEAVTDAPEGHDLNNGDVAAINNALAAIAEVKGA